MTAEPGRETFLAFRRRVQGANLPPFPEPDLLFGTVETAIGGDLSHSASFRVKVDGQARRVIATDGHYASLDDVEVGDRVSLEPLAHSWTIAPVIARIEEGEEVRKFYAETKSGERHLTKASGSHTAHGPHENHSHSDQEH